MRNVVIVGTGQPGRDFAESLESHGELALRVEGFVGDELPELASTRWPYLGPSERLIDVLHERVVDEVAICLPMEQWQLVDPIASLCEEEGKIVRIPVRISSRAITSGRVEELDGTPVLSLVTGPDRVGRPGRQALPRHRRRGHRPGRAQPGLPRRGPGDLARGTAGRSSSARRARGSTVARSRSSSSGRWPATRTPVGPTCASTTR